MEGVDQCGDDGCFAAPRADWVADGGTSTKETGSFSTSATHAASSTPSFRAKRALATSVGPTNGAVGVAHDGAIPIM